MRTLTDHVVEGDSSNHQLSIAVQDEPGQGGACHMYRIFGLDVSKNGSYEPCVGEKPGNYDGPEDSQWVMFQNGPIKEFGVNGITQEVLLAIIIDRLRSFQTGPFACQANAEALVKCEGALHDLQERTRERIKRGAEGTYTK